METSSSAQSMGSNTGAIPERSAAWAQLDFVQILTEPTAFISISQVNSLYDPKGGQADEQQWTRGSVENTIRVAKACRDLGARFFWIGYDIFRLQYPQSPMDASQYASWVDLFADWSEERRRWDGQLTPALRELVRPGDAEFYELALQSSFVGTPLDLHLRREGIRTLILCGLHLDWCIEGNARQARDLGYMPIVIGDASACRQPEDEPAAMRRINNYFAPVLSTDRVLSLIGEAVRRNEKGKETP